MLLTRLAKGLTWCLLQVLSDFKARCEPINSRKDYIKLLTQDICMYYGCNERTAETVLSTLSPAESVVFFEANARQRPTTDDQRQFAPTHWLCGDGNLPNSSSRVERMSILLSGPRLAWWCFQLELPIGATNE